VVDSVVVVGIIINVQFFLKGMTWTHAALRALLLLP